MAKKIIRTIISLIMPLAYMGFFGYLYYGIILDYREMYYKLTVVALVLAFTVSILIVACGLTEIEHIINYMVILVSTGIIIAITWIWMMKEFDAGIVFYSAYALPVYLIYYIWRKKKIKEIIVYMLINPIIYYLLFFMSFLFSLSELHFGW